MAHKAKSSRMEVNLGQVMASWPILNKLADKPKGGTATYRLTKALLALQPEVLSLDKARLTIYEQNGDLNEAKTEWILRPDVKESSEKELATLYSQTLKLNLKPIPLSQLQECGLNEQEFAVIDWLVNDDAN